MYNIVVVFLHLYSSSTTPANCWVWAEKKTKSPASQGIKLETKSHWKSGCLFCAETLGACVFQCTVCFLFWPSSGRWHGSFKKNKRLVKNPLWCLKKLDGIFPVRIFKAGSIFPSNMKILELSTLALGRFSRMLGTDCPLPRWNMVYATGSLTWPQSWSYPPWN